MTIKTRLYASLGALALSTLLLVGAFYYAVSSARNTAKSIYDNQVVPMNYIKTITGAYEIDIVHAMSKARGKSLSLADTNRTIVDARKSADEAWKAYQSTTMFGEEKALAEAVSKELNTSNAVVDQLVASTAAGDFELTDQIGRDQLYPVVTPLAAALDKLSAFQSKTIAERNAESEAQANRSLMIALALAGLAAAVIGMAIYTITRKVIAPIKNLASTINELATATGDARIPGIDQKDELGDISRAVDGYLAANLEKERQAAAVQSEKQERVTSALAEGLQAMAAGDMTKDVKVAFPTEYEGLKQNFNDALVSLRSLIGQVSESAQAIRTGSHEIAQASEDLARRTESNAASLEQTSAAVSQMDERIRTTASAADDTLKRANGTMGVVSNGRTIANEAVSAMGRVSESAKGIDSVIEGLDKIAFQTRVLAMNAAVEAGRAGEAGKGFAVVADLVSALAMRSEEEAQSAREQLTATQTDIVSAVGAVERVDGALADISNDVGEVNALLDRIAADNKIQSGAISEISTAVSSMDQAVQQNAAMVEETSAAARNLTIEVNSLADRAATFRVNGASGQTASNNGAYHAAPTSARAETVQLSPAIAARLNGSANGKANGKASANGHAADDWSSF